MATGEQLDFFRSVYENEAKRTSDLRELAKNNLALATVYSAFIVFVIDKLRPDSVPSKAMFVGALCFTLFSFLLSLWAGQIATFEEPSDPRSMVDELRPGRVTNEKFFDNRIADYTIAYERNSSVNDQIANRVQWARYALLVGLLLHGGYFVSNLLAPEIFHAESKTK